MTGSKMKVIVDGIEFESVDDAVEYIVSEMSDDDKEGFEVSGVNLADVKALCSVDKSARRSAMATYDSNIASCIACDITDMEADCEEEICGHCVKLLAE